MTTMVHFHFFKQTKSDTFHFTGSCISNNSITCTLLQVRTKVMLCPWRVFEVGIHHISKQNREEWLPLSVDPSLAIIHHYRSCVANLGMRCDTWVEDHTIPNRYGDKLVSRVEQVMRDVVRGYGSS